MIELILAHPHAFWLSLGGLLLAAEMLGASGWLLWAGIAGLITGLLTWWLPVSWEWQGLSFAVFTLCATVLWWRWLVKRQTTRPDPALNTRSTTLVGQQLHLENPLINGQGHIRLGDSSWPVVADDDLPAGTRVEIIRVEGIKLRIKQVPTPPEQV